MKPQDARRLLLSWQIAMEAERRSENTIASYALSVGQLLEWAAARGEDPDFTRPGQVRGWLADLARQGRKANTLAVKLAGVRGFAAFLADEGEISESGVHRIGWPKVDQTVPDALSPEQVALLISTCDAKSFTGIRDAAIIGLMFDSLLRSNELLSLRAARDGLPGDVDVRNRVARVRRGKGGKERYVAFSVQTARRLDRYQRHRERHKHAASGAYWLSSRGPFGYDGLYQMFTVRGGRVGLDVHPHMTRSGGAIQWRFRGGSTEGLMTIGGWNDLKMVQRYTRKAEIDLALNEAKRLHDRD